MGKRFGASLFAAALLCERPESGGCGHCASCVAVAGGYHPDLRVWDVPAGEKTFKVDQVRQLIEAVARRPYQGDRQVHILAALDAMASAGANALLKTLEEPPPTSTLILLARTLDNVLPTLVSRCQVVPFGLSAPEAIAEQLVLRHGVAPDAARELAFASQGRMGAAIAAAATPQQPPTPPTYPGPGPDALSWADRHAALPASEQLTALEGWLAWLRDGAWLASGGGWERVRHAHASDRLAVEVGSLPVAEWLALADAVEAARIQLTQHANAKLVFDGLARRLAASGQAIKAAQSG